MSIKENRWLAQARQLDEEILIEIYDHFSPALYRYALRLLGEPVAAEDIVAETFYRFLRALEQGGGPKNHLQAYLYRVAYNLIVDRSRQRQPEMNWVDIDAMPGDAPGPETIVTKNLEQARVRATLWKLTDDQRQVIVLKFIEGMSNAEVARILVKPVGAVKALQHRAINSMRRILQTADEEGNK
jgi:RNA polymerase sigma-70 factor, ECF subfamily